MQYYKVTKDYRGGQNTYYIALNDDEKITDDILESIGENTSGGENYGYSMRSGFASQVQKLRDYWGKQGFCLKSQRGGARK